MLLISELDKKKDYYNNYHYQTSLPEWRKWLSEEIHMLEFKEHPQIILPYNICCVGQWFLQVKCFSHFFCLTLLDHLESHQDFKDTQDLYYVYIYIYGFHETTKALKLDVQLEACMLNIKLRPYRDIYHLKTTSFCDLHEKLMQIQTLSAHSRKPSVRCRL